MEKQKEKKKTIINYDSFNRPAYLVLRYGGFWFITEKPPSLIYKLYYICVNFITVTFNLMLVLAYTFKFDLNNFTEALYISPSAIMGNVNSFIFFKYRKEMYSLMTELNQKPYQSKTPKELAIAKNGLKTYVILRNLLVSTSFVSWFIGSISAYFKRQLIYPGWYPFDVEKSPSFDLVVLQQTVGGAYIAISKIYVICFLGGIQQFLGVQCDFLCSKLESVGQNGEPFPEKDLKDHIRYHKSILRLAALTQKIFDGIYFGDFSATVLSLSVTLFLISIRSTFNTEVVFLMGYLVSTIIILFYYSYFATILTNKSENIPNAAYSCRWVGSTKSFQKSLMYLIYMSQSPIKFYMYGLVNISLETFVTVMKSSFSFYTVIQNMMTEDK